MEWYDENTDGGDASSLATLIAYPFVGLVTPLDVGLSSFVGLSTHLACHSSRGFDFG